MVRSVTDISIKRGRKTQRFQLVKEQDVGDKMRKAANLAEAARKLLPFNRLTVSDICIAQVPMIHFVADKKNVLIINNNFIQYNEKDCPTNLKELLPYSVTVVKNPEDFRNMTILRNDKLFTFSYEPHNRIFLFSEQERCHETIGECSSTLYSRGLITDNPSAIQIKAVLKVNDKGRILKADVTLFNIACTTISEKDIRDVFKKFAEDIEILGCDNNVALFDYTATPEMPFMAGYLRKNNIHSLGQLKKHLGIA